MSLLQVWHLKFIHISLVLLVLVVRGKLLHTDFGCDSTESASKWSFSENIRNLTYNQCNEILSNGCTGRSDVVTLYIYVKSFVCSNDSIFDGLLLQRDKSCQFTLCSNSVWYHLLPGTKSAPTFALLRSWHLIIQTRKQIQKTQLPQEYRKTVWIQGVEQRQEGSGGEFLKIWQNHQDTEPTTFVYWVHLRFVSR